MKLDRQKQKNMKKSDKTREQLVKDLEKSKKRIAELEKFKTEYKQAEKELQEKQKELDIIFDSVPAMIWSKNIEGKYLQVNRAYCKAVGLSLEKILGRTDYDLYPTDIADQYFKYDQEINNSGKPVSEIEERHLKPSGDYGWSLTEKMPRCDAEGNVVGTIGFAIDITERKQAEEKLKQKMKQLERFNKVAVDRELRMIEMKREINDLLEKAGLEKKYSSPD